MSENSRTKNAKLNVIYGYLAQIGILILSFVGRKIFLIFLSADYLGINGLYSNILTILSSAELGLDTAVVYSLYKPVADDNKKLIASMLRYFKKVYYIVAICVFLAGLCLLPFLPFFIKSNLSSIDLAIYYILFLINTVSSYFVAYKVALLSAYQEQRIHKLVTLSANLILQLMHIIVLFIWKNYYIYIVATVVSTVISNTILLVQKAPACTIRTQAEAVLQLFGGDEKDIKVIGIRHGEKMYETLLTNEECANAVDLGNFYRVPCDKRGLNYDKYFNQGNTERNTLTEFNSNNTKLLSVEETREKIASLAYIREELAKNKK